MNWGHCQCFQHKKTFWGVLYSSFLSGGLMSFFFCSSLILHVSSCALHLLYFFPPDRSFSFPCVLSSLLLIPPSCCCLPLPVPGGAPLAPWCLISTGFSCDHRPCLFSVWLWLWCMSESSFSLSSSSCASTTLTTLKYLDSSRSSLR